MEKNMNIKLEKQFEEFKQILRSECNKEFIIKRI